MRPIQNADGHVGLTARNYPIDPETAVTMGQVVKLTAGKVVPAGQKETGALLGIAAEDHTGVEDALNFRSNAPEVLVCDSPGLIFECRAPKVIAGSGTATSLTARSGQVGGAASGAFAGGVLVMRQKAAGSGNTDAWGQRRAVTAYASGGVFTLTAGGVPGEGDEYELYPPIGSAVCALDDERETLTVTDTGATSLRVIGHDYERHMLRCMAALHTLN